MTGLFDPGTYTVFADARERDATGKYSLLLETAPPAGSGTSGDGCGDALRSPRPRAATDRRRHLCGARRRRGELRRSRSAGPGLSTRRLEALAFAASLDAEEAPHVLVLWRRCAERASEVSCGRPSTRSSPPAPITSASTGRAPDSFGRFTVNYALRDLTGQGAACGRAPLLSEGRPFSATTAGGTDKFMTSCGASDAAASGPDKVFKLVCRTVDPFHRRDGARLRRGRGGAQGLRGRLGRHGRRRARVRIRFGLRPPHVD